MKEIRMENVRCVLDSGKMKLKPTQKAISLPIVKRICKKMQLKITFDGIKVSENRIIEGHHRYVSSVLTQVGIEYIESGAPGKPLQVEWSDLKICEIDYDKPEEVLEHNRNDAARNNMELETLEALLRNIFIFVLCWYC